MKIDTGAFLQEVKFNNNGLVTAIAQDYQSSQILMVAYMNSDTLTESLTNGKMVYWSRSRKQRWLKGEESGNIQRIKNVRIDCDGDILLFAVEQMGNAACHLGYQSCFYRRWTGEDFVVKGKKVFDPKKVYKKM